MPRFIALLIAPVAFILLALWADAANAATYEEHSCRAVPLTQHARPGETVLVCELRRVPTVVQPAPVLRYAARVGHTVVVARLGR